MLVSLLVVLTLTAIGWWISSRNPIGRQLGTTMVVLLIGFLVTNLSGWQPHSSVSGWVSGPLTSLAITQLLLAVDLRRIWPEARRLVIPFAASAISTLMAVLAGAVLFSPWLGAQSALLAGVFTATFTGGSLNFVSVARTLTLSESLMLLATAADHVVFAAWFAISVLIGRRWGQRSPSDALQDSSRRRHGETDWTWQLILWSLLWSGAVLGSAEWLTQLIHAIWPTCPSILVLTTLSLVVAQMPGARSRRGCYGMGLVLIQPFFTVIGLSSPVAGLLGRGFPVLVYAAFIVTMQASVLLLMRRWRNWPAVETLVASQAAIGGPSTALALATSLGRPSLALPGVAIGLVGYLVGTYLGLIATGVLGLL